MPIAGTVQPPARETPYFSNLDDLDTWAASPTSKIEGLLPYSPRPDSLFVAGNGRLQVCHDYKNGYSEDPFDRTYTFNFYSQCDMFIYFSHHRVTIPPPGWVNAAHRQGAKMLGTLIFEGDSQGECTRLCMGDYPSGVNSPFASAVPFPLSAQFAITLANLAYQRGFDGWLMNFETSLEGGSDQARAVSAWLTILQSAMEAMIGPHVETIWYDSVTTSGYVGYQNRLDAPNLPFFLSSTGLFTNYWWRPGSKSSTDPTVNTTYFDGLPASLTGNTTTSQPEVAKKETNNIYLGIDVYGRSSYGGGGFGLYKALTHVSPLQRQLSAALFAPGWTWESQQDKSDFTWDTWWAYDQSLWVGTTENYTNQPADPGCNPGDEGNFVPIVNYFSLLGPPDPLDLPFFCTFSPGTGLSWFVNGIKVLDGAKSKGWSDLDKQTSVGDLVWPVPSLAWATATTGDSLPDATTALATDDAYLGGSSLRLGFTSLGSVTSTASVWVPIQSLNITLEKSYEAILYYKIEKPTTDTTLLVDLGVQPLGTDISASSIGVTVITAASTVSSGVWAQVSIAFTVSGTPSTTTQLALGLVLSSSDSSTLPDISLLLGQICVIPSFPDAVSIVPPILLYANLQSDTSASGSIPNGLLSWAVGAAIPKSDSSNSDAAQANPYGSLPGHYQVPLHGTLLPRVRAKASDEVSAWKIQPSNPWFPTLVYANIYAIRFASGTPPTNPPTLGDTSWIGTSGLDGRTLSFLVVGGNLPSATDGQNKVRFWVQGVTDRGEVMNWDQCVYTDVDA